LTKTGAGILDLSADNTITGSFTFTGPTVVNGGLVLVNSDSELGAAPSSLNAAAVVLNGGGIENDSSTAAAWNANRGITVGPQGGTLSWVSTNTSTINWKTSVTGPGGMTFSMAPYNYNGKTTGGTLALDLTGSQALSYQGGTTLNATTNSVIQWTSGLGASSQQLPVGTAVTLTGGGTVNLGDYSQTIGSLAGAAGAGTITNFVTLTLGGAAGSPVNQTASYGGALTGNGGVVMNGLGTQTFGGANTYTGGTTINAGGLLINGALASTANTVTVASGALLGGSGSIAGSVNFSAGSILAPAGSPTGYSHLTVTNSVAIPGGSFFDFNLAASGSTMNNDQLLVTGTGNTLTLSGSTDTLNVSATNLAVPGGYTGSFPLSLVLLKAPSLTDSIPQSGWTIHAPGGYNMQVVGPNDTTSAGSLIDGVAGELILYVAAPTLTWTGATNGNWDFSTANWTSTIGGNFYREGGNVVFDDSTAGRNTTVTITAASVSPSLVTFNNAAYNYTINGVIAGNGGLVKQGSGMVTLNGADTYGGGTTISAGTLQLGDGTAHNGSVQNDIVDNGALTFANPFSQTYGGQISGSGSLTKTGTGILTLTGNSTYSGGTTISTGVLQLGDGVSQNGSVAGNIANNSVLNFANPLSQTFAGIISGGGSVAKNAGGTLTFTGSNTYTGGTTIWAGLLQLGDGTANNGYVQNNVTDDGTLAFANPLPQAYPGVISGAGSLLKSGTGTLTLTGTNTYSGGTTVAGGTLAVASTAALPGYNASASVFVQNGGVLSVCAGGGGWALSDIGNLLSANGVNFAPGSMLGIDTTNASIVYGAALAGNMGLAKLGSNTLTLSGAETYNGGTAISGGTLIVNSALPASTTVQASGGTLVFNNASQTLAGLNGSSGGTVTLNPTLLSVAGGSFGGTITGSGGLNVTGLLALTNTANGYAYTGGTTVASGGTLSVAAGSTPGTSTGRITLNGGVLSLSPTTSTTASSAAGIGLFAQCYTPDNIQGPINNSGLAGMLAQVAADTRTGTAFTSAGGNQQLDFSNGGTYNGNAAFSVLGFNNADNYDVVMQGAITLSQVGTYHFATRSDDGSMLWIDGQQVVWNNNYQGATTATGAFAITSTGVHQITIGYYQGGGGEGLLVQYEAPNATSYSTIPNSILGLPAGVPYNNPVTLASSSTLDAEGSGLITDLGALTVPSAGNTLTTTGPGVVRFAGTSLNGNVGFTVNSQELALGQINTNGTAATIAVGGSGVLTLTSTGSSNPLPAGSSFQVAGGGTLLAAGSDAFQGAPITLNTGSTLILAATSAAVSYDVMLPTSANPMTFSGTSATILAGVGPLNSAPALAALSAGGLTAGTVTLASNGTLGVAAGQTLNLGANASYAMVQGPSLVLSDSGTISVLGAGNVTLAGANLAFAGTGTLSAASLGTGTVLGPVAAGIYSPQNTGTIVLAGNYSGSPGNLVPAAGGTVVLNASNSVTGTLNVTGGAFIAGNSASFGTTTLQFNGGTIGANTALTGSNAITNSMTWGANPSITISTGYGNNYGTAAIQFTQPLSLPLAGTNYHISDYNGYSTFSGAISGSGTLYLSGYPTISNSNTYTGGTVLNNGCPVITNNQALGPGAIYFANNGGNGGLQCSTPLTGALAVTNAWSVQAGQTPNFYGLPALELTQGTTLTGNVGFNVTYNANGQQGRLQIDGPISDGGHGYGLWKGGGATLTLASTGSTYSGGTYLNNGNGNLDVPVSSVGPAGSPSSGPLGTGTLYINNNNGNGGINIGNYTGTAPVTIANPLNISGPCGYDGGQYFAAGAGLTFTGPIVFTQNATNKNVTTPVNSQIFTAHDVTFAGNISNGSVGAYALWLASGSNWNTGGALTVSGTNNTFSGGVAITQGTLVVASSGAMGPASNTITLNDGNTAGTNDGQSALLIGGPYTVPNAINVTNNGNGSYLGGNTANSSVFSGPITLGKTATLVAASGGTATFAKAISGAGGVVVGAAPGAVNYNGTVALSGNNSYTGGTTVAYGTLAMSGGTIGDSAGTVTVQSGGTLGTLPPGPGVSNLIASAVVVNSGGVLSATVGTPLNISKTLTMNDGSSFGLTASGGSVSVANVSSLSLVGNLSLQVALLDYTTLTPGSVHTFLNWASGGPGDGSNWTVVPVGGNATWTAGSGSWGTYNDWRGLQVNGGSVVATGSPTGSGSLQLVGATALAYSVSGPTAVSNVFIQVPGASVSGPSSASGSTTSIASLTLGSSSGSPTTLSLDTSPLSVTAPAGTTVNATGILNVSGGSLSTTALTVASGGQASVGAGGNLMVSAAATIAGSLTANGTSGSPALADNTGASLAVTGTANFGANSSVGLPSVTVSGSGQFAALGAGSIGSLSLSGGSTATATVGSGVALSTANVAAGTAVFNSTAPMTSLTLSGGTATLANQSVATATISGAAVLGISPTSTAVIPTFNYGSSNPITIPATMSLGSAAATISAGAVVLNNTNAMGSLTVSGGTATLGGNQSVTTVTVSGVAVLGISPTSTAVIPTFDYGSSNPITIPATMSLGSTAATISAGAVVLNNTNAMGSLTVSGGTATLGGNQSATTVTVSGAALLGISPTSTASFTTFNYGSSNPITIPATMTVGNAAATISAGAVVLDNTNAMGSLTVSGGTATLGGNQSATTVTVSGAAVLGISPTSTASFTTFNYGSSNPITIPATMTVGNAAATISAGAVVLNNTNAMTSLTVTGGSVTTGPGVTAVNVSINGVGTLGTAVNTAANFLSVTNSLNVMNPAANITVTGSSFAVKGTNVVSNIDALQLSGGTTALNYQPGALLPGLAIRAWSFGGGGSSLDTYTGAAGANPPNMSYDPSSLAGKIGTSTASTFAGTLNPMNIAINVPSATQEWFQSGGMGTGPIPTSAAPTGYVYNITIEYRGELYVPATGTYYFATASDDGSALWIDPGTDNPTYNTAGSTSNAIVQNDYGQGITPRYSAGISLTQGYHDFLVRNNQGGGPDALEVFWGTTANPNVATNMSLIPGSDFYFGGYAPGPAAMPNTNVVVTAASMFSPGNGYANTFGSLTLGGNLTFSGGSAAGTSASFSGITATTTAAIGNDATTSDVTTVIVQSGGTVAVSNNQTLTFNAPAVFGTGGAGAVTVGSAANAGTVVLASPASPATHLLNGNLNVNGGTLWVNGTLAGSGNLTVGGGAILGGSGSITAAGAGVFIQSGGTLAPHIAAAGANTLTIGSVATPSALTLAGGSILAFNMGAPGSTDMVQVNGNLTLNSGTDVLNVNCLTGFTYGTYELIGYTGSLANSASWTVNHAGSVPANAQFGLATPGSGAPPGEIILTVSSGTLTWTGAGGSNWNTTEVDWSGTHNTYSDGALVTFPSGVSHSNITVAAAGVSPVSVNFTNTTSTHYILGGGPINGAASLTVSGGGVVTLNNAGNGYSAGTLVAKGTLQLGANGALPAGGAVTVSAQGILDTEGYAPSPGTVTLSGGALQSSVGGGSLNATSYVLQGGSVTLPLGGGTATLTQNASTTTLSAANTYGGVTMVNAGTLVLASAGSLTGTTAINVGGGTAAATMNVAGAVNGAVPITVNAQGVYNVNSAAGAGSGAVTINPSGTFNINAAGASTGPITVNSQGTLGIGASGMAAPAVTINAGGILAGLTPNAFAFTGANPITVPAQLQIAADGALGTPSSNLAMAPGSYYNFTAQQSLSPNLTIATGMGLFGNTTNFDFNPADTPAVTFQPNAVFAPSSGPSPTRAQLGGAATLLLPILATDTGQVYSVGDNGSTSIYRGLALGSWSTVGGAGLAAGAPVTLALTASDTASNGFAIYMNGHDTTINSSTILDTGNTTTGVEFDGSGNLILGSTAGAGGTATVYSRVGVLNATTNTSGGTNGTNPTLVSFTSATNNLAGKTLNLQNLTLGATNAQFLAANGTINFGACSALSAPGVSMSQGTLNFAASALYRLDSDTALGGGATWNFQPGSMISLTYNPNTSALVAPASAEANVDLICSTTISPQTVSGTNPITLGNGRTISTPWEPGLANPVGLQVAAASTATITAASGASYVRFGAANGNTLSIDVPLNLPSTTLQINDTPSNTLYVPYDGDANLQRQPGGSILNGTVVLSNSVSSLASTVSSVYVAGGTLLIGSSNALGATPVAMTVGAQTANAATATFDLNGNDVTLSTLSGSSLGLIQNSGTAPNNLWVNVPSGGTSTYAGTLTDGAGGLILRCEGPGTLVLTGSNIYSGGTSIDGGTLQLGNGGGSGSVPIAAGYAILNNGILAFNRSDSVTVAGQITGTGGVVQMGPGTLSLTAYNNYSGGTTVSGGTLGFAGNSLGNGTVLVNPGNGNTAGLTWTSSSPDLTVNGLILASGNTVFDLGGASTTNPVSFYSGTIAGTGSLEITDGTLQIGYGGTTGSLGNLSAITIDAGGVLAFDRDDTALKPYVVPGAIGGGGGLLQKEGYLVLTGSNTFTGGTSVSGGTLQLGNGGGTGSVAGIIDLTSSYSALAYNRSDTVTLSAQLIGSGNLLQMGPGRLILTGSNAYGSATIDAGATLEIDSAQSIGNGALYDSGSLAFNASSGTVLNVTNSISGTGSVVQQGSGSTVWLKASNNYSGGTTLSAGTLEFSSGIGAGPVYVNPGNGNTAGLTWYNNSWDPTATGRGLTLASGNTLFTLGGYSVAFTGTIAGTGSLEISGGTLQLGNFTSTGSLGNLSAVTIDSGGVLAFDLSTTSSVTGALAGNGSLLQERGYLILTGSNTFAGGTSVSGGTLQLGNGGGTGSVAGIINVSNSSYTLAYNRSDTVTLSGQLTGSGSLLQMGPGRLILAGSNAYSNATIDSGAVLEIDSSTSVGTGSLTDSGSLAFNAASGSTVTVGGAISGTGSVVQQGSGSTVYLSGGNSYSGGTTVTGGTLKFGSNSLGTGPVWVDPGNGNTAGLTWTSATPDLTATGRGLTLNSGNTLFTLGSNSVAFTGTIAGTGSLEIGGGTLQIGNNTTTGSLGNVSAVTIDSGGVLAFDPSNTSIVTVAGAIVGSGTLLQKAGTLVLTGSNTYSGGTSVSGGTLQLGNGGGSGSVAGNVYLYSGETLAYNRSDTVTVSGQLTGSGNLLQMGPGRLILAGSNAYSNATINSGAVLEIDSSTSIGTGSLTDSGSLAFNAPSGGTLTLNGAISGTGSVVQQGSGSTVYLDGNNSYSGGTTITAGTLKFGSSSLSNNGPVWVDPGNGNTAGLTWTASTPNLISPTRGLTLNSGNTLFTIPSGLSVSCTGTIAGTGSMEISGGTLQIGSGSTAGSLGTVSAVALYTTSSILAFDRTDPFATAYTVPCPISGAGGFYLESGAVTLTGAVALSGTSTLSSGTLTFNSTGASTLSGSVAGYAGALLVQAGPGTLSLTASNSYSGGTSVTGGALDFVAHALGTGKVTVNPGAGNTATLIWDQSNGTNIFDLTSQNSSNAGLTLSSGTTTLDLKGQLVTFGTNGSSSNDTIQGTGGLGISGGTLQLNSNSGLGTLTSVSLVNNGDGPGYLALSVSGSPTLSIPFSGVGGLIQQGTNNVTISNASNTFSGQTQVIGGTLTLGNATALQDSTLYVAGGTFSFGSLTAATLGGLTGSTALPLLNASSAAVTLSLGDNLAVSPTYSGVLSGGTGSKLIKVGSDTQVLAGSNTYTGGTTISNGTLQLGAGGGTGSVTGGVFVASGAALAIDRSDTSYSFSTLVSGSGGVEQVGPDTLTLAAANTYSGGTTIIAGALSLPSTLGSGGVVVNPGSGNTASIIWSGTNTTDLSTTQGLTFASGTALLSLGSNSVTFQGTVTGTGSFQVTSGTLTLGSATTFQNSTLDPSGAGKFSFGSFTAVTLGGLTGSGALPLTNASSQAVVLSVGNNNANATYSGVLSGGNGSGLIKIGTGTEVLSGNNTFTGGTTISNGTLQLGAGLGTGSLATTAAIVDNGVLALDRSDVPYAFANQITGTGGVRQMGPGTLTVTSSNTYTGGTTVSNGELAAENKSAIPSGSLLSIGANGSVVLGTPGATEPLDLLAGGAGPLTSSQASGGGSQVASPALSGGVNAVPEPSTLVLLGVAGLGLLAWRRRRWGAGSLSRR
jgi:autotransporter-associated beta strand protein